MHPIVAIWAHPRSLSTLLERVFIERGDFKVIHEPFSVVYYLHEQRASAASAEFLPQDNADYESVRSSILQAGESEPVCFKDMCYHCHDHLIRDDAFLQRLTNVFLIRDPAKAVASHFAKNAEVTQEEIGYAAQVSVFRRAREITGVTPTVVAAEDLQSQPERTLDALCARLGLDAIPEALQWEEGQLQEWQNWKHWHSEVAQSTGVQQRQTQYADTVENNPRLAELYESHLPHYQELREHLLDVG